MNWVDRLHHRKMLLISGSAILWNDIRAAIQDACDSYNKHAQSSAGNVNCVPENGKRLRVSKLVRETKTENSYRDDMVTVLISFDLDGPSINVVGDGPVPKAVFNISADDENAFIGTADEHLSADQISEKILRPLLYPTGNYSDPH
jgi:hypothetical protein